MQSRNMLANALPFIVTVTVNSRPEPEPAVTGPTPSSTVRVSPVGSLFFLLGLATIAGFFLINGPGYYAARSLRDIWNFGHIPVFAFWAWIGERQLARHCSLTFPKRFLLILLITLVLGTGIELLQQRLGRTFALEDIARDLCGTLLALSFVPSSRQLPGRTGIAFLRGASLLFLFILSLPPAITVYDEYQARRQFPLLAGFETPFEDRRFSGSAAFSRDISPGNPRNNALKITFSTEGFSDIKLQYFPPDWRDFTFLRFDVDNPSAEPVELFCRIHDQDHLAHNQSYRDRYTVALTVRPGSQTFSLPMTDIRNGPDSRQMDLAAIRALGFFVRNAPKEHLLYLDNIVLVANDTFLLPTAE